MMRKIHWYGVALAAAALATLAVTPASAEGKKVCYAFQDLSTGFWVAGHKAIVTTLQANGVEVVELNGGKDANRQLEQVKDCIAQGADGIILTADDSESETMLVALAQEADVPIATFNRPPSDMSKGIIVVADNEAVARQAVEAMAAKAI
jgi:inositol transport system substrate-binding protein